MRSDRRFERCLDDAHHAVVAHHARGAEVGHGDQRTAVGHQRLQALAMRRKLWQETFMAESKPASVASMTRQLQVFGVAEGHQ